MKTTTFTIALLLLSFIGFSQEISNVNFDQIKRNIEDSTSQYYYPDLTERLLAHDNTLSFEDYKHLYYGNVYTDVYSPYAESHAVDTFLKIYNNKQYAEAIPLGRQALQENPIDIKVTFKMLICYHVLEIKDTAQIYANKYHSLLDVIYSSGDGKSVATSYVVIKVNDEYQVLGDLQLKCTGQSLLSGPCDRLTIDKKNQKKIKGQKKIKELYFNITKPFEYLSKQFSPKEEE